VPALTQPERLTSVPSIGPFHRPCREENLPGVICFTENHGSLSYLTAMAQKTLPSSFDPKAGLGTDYALITTGLTAALFALVYLILI